MIKLLVISCASKAFNFNDNYDLCGSLKENSLVLSVASVSSLSIAENFSRRQQVLRVPQLMVY